MSAGVADIDEYTRGPLISQGIQIQNDKANLRADSDYKRNNATLIHTCS